MRPATATRCSRTPLTAEHVVTRLYGQIGSDQPLPAAGVTGLADAFRSTWDISPLVTSIMLSSDFVSAQSRLVIGPVEWLVGALRALQVPVADDAAATALAKKADLSWISGAAQAGRVDEVGYRLGVGAWSNRSRSVLQDAIGDPHKLCLLYTSPS